MEKVCRKCGKPYIVKDEADDSYCSFLCWEEANCIAPSVKLERESVEEILAYKN